MTARDSKSFAHVHLDEVCAGATPPFNKLGQNDIDHLCFATASHMWKMFAKIPSADLVIMFHVGTTVDYDDNGSDFSALYSVQALTYCLFVRYSIANSSVAFL
jgi:hypothetical protein